jgi:hypothetical protein
MDESDNANDSGELLHRGSRDARGRFVKGMPSANPDGAPIKAARSKNLTYGIDPTAELVVRLGRLPAARRADGSTVDRYEKALDELYRRAVDRERPNMRALTEYLKITSAAQMIAQQHRLKVLGYAHEYKTYWKPRFELAEVSGSPHPSTLPHPDDVILEGDGTVTFDGPLDREGQEQMLMRMRLRDHYIRSLPEISSFELANFGVLAEAVEFLISEALKLNRQLPRRLQMPADQIRDLAFASAGDDEP